MHDLSIVLKAALGPRAVRQNESLARYTAIRIGGPADLLAVAGSVETLRQAVALAGDHGIPWRVLGGGSNVLVGDAGIRGLVILNRAKAITFAPRLVRAESGASLSMVARQSVARGLVGLEWAAGIPGTVGGAVVGNAGAWGSDIASTLLQATVLEAGGGAAEWPVERFEYGYRTSILKQQGSNRKRQVVVLEAKFALEAGEREELQARVAEISARRKASQPPGATCGSVFKNPPDDYAGRLIEAAGLKGQRRGGARISTVHANFIVNHGDATATDVRGLIDLVRQTVLARFGVTLELEIELIGDWSDNSRAVRRSQSEALELD